MSTPLDDVRPSPLVAEAEERRAWLHDLAYRLLGSASEADTVVERTLDRLRATPESDVLDLGTWLVTDVGRDALRRLRERRYRRAAQPVDTDVAEAAGLPAVDDPAREAGLAQEVGVTLLADLEGLAPAERVAHVLHDVLGLHFEDVAGVLGRTSCAARQLAGRARAELDLLDHARPTAAEEHRAFVVSLLSRMSGPLPAGADGARSPLAQTVELRSDAAAARAGLPDHAVGRARVAAALESLQEPRPVVLDGYAAIAGHLATEPVLVGLVVDDEGVTQIDAIADPVVLDLLDLHG
ncbi:RNA polymerase subunit sigma-70 [Nocardioides acrostichi]|uniref:RNA polymerase subunit sigma-70 n=1 Tax=Nocardioides acrostichi TaxID=2784339 RepID=A0A930UZP2_9ACTN|nr:RNA polymerase subunit sigma-70 [Nocardioides acrostichi]MBF4161057.1 RNA polymerase subunit sigma-70 [Nocardioides acrostichi]